VFARRHGDCLEAAEGRWMQLSYKKKKLRNEAWGTNITLG
jgi:hypothetical protein